MPWVKTSTPPKNTLSASAKADIQAEAERCAFSLDNLEPASVIEGDVTWLGGNGRMRGVSVEGALTTNANGFSAAFNRINSASVTGNGVTLIRNAFVGNAIVPSSSAVLVDNSGIP